MRNKKIIFFLILILLSLIIQPKITLNFKKDYFICLIYSRMVFFSLSISIVFSNPTSLYFYNE